ncbi:LAQU0S14e02102g1_1 [Lachancea quebecensis]|uniref:Kinesin-like protein n=1 Tax=Lachancea quebecensis TaxID=1654605 RepID=A0A0P1KXN8_9SACH|nr:LAQU0S14e02102g1_1 [Lachancea quebecensis]
MDSEIPHTRQSSIVVSVRVRPFTAHERAHLVNEQTIFGNLQLGDPNLALPGVEISTPTKIASSRHRPQGVRQIVDCVDDKMLIFDPAENNPLSRISENVLNSITAPPSGHGPRSLNSRRSGEQKFVFDRVFDMHASQEEVYEATTRPLLDSVLDGFNSTVFAYGATGCGKTHTVSGTAENPGIIFLTMQELFAKMEQLKDTKKFELTASYLEIYNESIRDLLEPETPSKKLVLREDAHRHISVANLSHHPLFTVENVMDLVVKGNINRTTSATDANETSSRSHAVLQVHITQKNRTAELTEDHKFATLSLIDLAGSERASATKNRGERLHEGANINRSLLALGNCINALCVGGKRGGGFHVPYRDSKLTRLLKFSLGGNCKTVMIVCISPTSNHYDETLNTLKYATRAKEIKTKIIRNHHSLDRHVGSYLKMITEQRQEIEELRSRERKMIDLELSRYKISRERVQMSVWDSVQSLRQNYKTSEKFHHLKVIKSLMLCKRRFLQMVGVELTVLLKFTSPNSDIHANCMALHEQLVQKVKNLEQSFDSPDELESAIEHTRQVDLVKLQEMEGWAESDLVWYESLLSWVSESVRNEILVGSSLMMERLMEDRVLMDRLKFVSETLLSFTHTAEGNEDHSFDFDSLTEQLHGQIRDLVNIDDEFDRFAASVQMTMAGMRDRTLVSAEALQERDFRKGALSLQVPHHRRQTRAKVVKSSSGTPSPVQRSRASQGSKTAKKVRWSEVLPGNDTSSMMMDEDNSQPQHSTHTAASEEDVSMLDAADSAVAPSEGIYNLHPTLAPRDIPPPRKVSLTATALVRGK